jgi:hypothetical protein
MFTPTSRVAALAAAAAILGACAENTMQISSPSRASVSVGGAPIAVAAPAGFCIDAQSTSVDARGAFVMVSDCGLLGQPGGATPPVAAVMTGSFSANPDLIAEGGDTTLDDLEAFLATARGRAVLGRSGDAGATRVVQATRQGDVLFVLVEDRGRSPLPGVEPRFWRAFMTVNGRMAALSIQGFDGAAPGLDASLRHLAAFAASLRAANPRA